MHAVKYPFLIFVSFINLSIALAQVKVSGIITDSKMQPLIGASVSIKGTYDGATTGSSGNFSFTTLQKGEGILIVSHIGYDVTEIKFSINQSELFIKVILQKSVSELKAVTVTAGTFEASDRKRTTVLKPIDIVTTAGAQADIFAAINTLPGAQQIGESEGLFVRGGTGAETKVFIDGLLVNNPFNSSVPDISQRSRFSPLLFKGTIFSSGGYSAQYGQGMSSALILESVDLPVRSEVQLSFTSIGGMATLQKLSRRKTFSIGGSVYYGNMGPYYQVIKQIPNFTKAPENIYSEFFIRKKTKSEGMFKFYFYSSYGKVSLNRQSLSYPDFNDHFSLENKNLYSNTSYQVYLKNGWKFYTGISISLNTDKVSKNVQDRDTIFNNLEYSQNDNLFQSRLLFTKSFKKLSKIYIGSEFHCGYEKIDPEPLTKVSFYNNILSVFTESDIYITQKFVSRIGVRYEYSKKLNEPTIAPRLSIAYKLKSKSQFSIAYGWFYQQPDTKYLFVQDNLKSSRAEHYILNFQHLTETKTLRVELYVKDYNKLISYDSSNISTAANKGNGIAKGIEIFWRDKKGFKGIDYWVSYSFLDTRRKFLNYPISVQPNFAAKHTLNLVMKKFVNSLSTNFGLTYAFASGRPYYNPNKPLSLFMSDKTINYHSMGLTINYLTQFLKTNSVVFLYITKVLGSKQIFGYNFSDQKNAQGLYTSAAVVPTAKRFLMVGIFISMGVDRRQDIINNY